MPTADEIDARIHYHRFMDDLHRAYPAAATHPELADRLLREHADRLSPMTKAEALHELGGLIDQALEKRRKRDARTAELAVYDTGSPGPGGESLLDQLDEAEPTSLGDIITKRHVARRERFNVLATKQAKEARRQRRA